jgi:hypothetical protein
MTTKKKKIWELVLAVLKQEQADANGGPVRPLQPKEIKERAGLPRDPIQSSVLVHMVADKVIDYYKDRGYTVAGAVVTTPADDLALWSIMVRLLQSQVYFIREDDNGPIKIGYAKNVLTRLSQLQPGNPSALRVVATVPGGEPEEKRLHQRFHHLKIRGEWYKANDELLDYIVKNTDGWPMYDQELSKRACASARSIIRDAKKSGLPLETYLDQKRSEESTSEESD